MSARPTHWREDLIATLLGALLVAGLFLDGWHHLALAHGADESFFSPWHLPLFVGFNACAIWTITRNDRLRAMLTGSGSAARAGAAPRRALSSAHVALLGLALAALGTAGHPFGLLVIVGAAVVLAACVRAITGPIAIDRRVALASACAFALTAGAFGAAGLNRKHDTSASPVAASDSASSEHEHHHAAAAAAPAAAAASGAAVKAKATSREASTAAPARHAAVSHRARTTAAPRSVAAHRADTTSAADTAPAATHHSTHRSSTARPVVRHGAPVVHRPAVARPAPHRAPSRPAPDRITVSHPGSGFTPDTIPSAPAPSPAAIQTTTTTTTTPADTSSSGSTSSSPSSPTSAPTPAPAPSPTPVRKGGPGPG